MRVRFGEFLLDTEDRLLRQGKRPVELNGRYFDALVLLVRQSGRLVSKDRFFDEVWRGVPVTDEALTQCVRTLRRQLGDNAAAPLFIETVPKHGYRFIAPVEGVEAVAAEASEVAPSDQPGRAPRPELRLIPAGAAGGAFGGVFGGLFYGLAGTTDAGGGSSGGASLLLVLLFINVVVGALGAAGASLGIALTRRGRWTLLRSVTGGALGGLVVGALVKLIGNDAFALLLGQSPGDVTGGGEGALLGAAIGLGAWAAHRRGRARLRLGVAAASVAGGLAGLLIAVAGGRLMGGSLHLLSAGFPQSRLRLHGIGWLLGENGFGPRSHLATSVLEGAVFCGCVVALMVLARRRGRLSAARS